MKNLGSAIEDTVDTEDVEARIDRLEENAGERYDYFLEHGADFLHITESAISGFGSHWADAKDILEASEVQKGCFSGTGGERTFAGILNLLVEAEFLNGFQSSPPYSINVEEYDPDPVIEAWEYATGEEFHEYGDQEIASEENPAPPLETDDLYQELMD